MCVQNDYIYTQFRFLVDEYNMQYAYNTFPLSENWGYSAYSFYNDTGCFTIYSLPARDELSFYRSDIYWSNWHTLSQQGVDMTVIEPEIWKKRMRIGFIPNPFFWWNTRKVITVAVEALKEHIRKNGSFLGIKVKS